jgi:hypothetical protein
MNTKALIVTTVLAVGTHSAWGHSSSPSPQSQDQPPTQLKTKIMEQRSLLRHAFTRRRLHEVICANFSGARLMVAPTRIRFNNTSGKFDQPWIQCSRITYVSCIA